MRIPVGRLGWHLTDGRLSGLGPRVCFSRSPGSSGRACQGGRAPAWAWPWPEQTGVASAPSAGPSAGIARVQGGGVVSGRCLRAAVFSGGPSSPAHFPRSPGPRGVLALNRAGPRGWGSQPPGRAELHQPGLRWRSGFGVRFQRPSQLLHYFCGFGPHTRFTCRPAGHSTLSRR